MILKHVLSWESPKSERESIDNRAIRRMGELAKEIEAAINQHTKSAGMGAPTGRLATMQEAGISKHQAVQAIRVVNAL